VDCIHLHMRAAVGRAARRPVSSHHLPTISYHNQNSHSATPSYALVTPVVSGASICPSAMHAYLPACRELSAGGFPVQNLLCVGDSSGADALGDVSRALPHIPGATDGVLLVASLDVFYGPTLNLTQLLEHTIVRGKTTLVRLWCGGGGGEGRVTSVACGAEAGRITHDRLGELGDAEKQEVWFTSDRIGSQRAGAAHSHVQSEDKPVWLLAAVMSDACRTLCLPGCLHSLAQVYHKPPPGRSMAGQAEVLINTAQTITLTGQATNPRGNNINTLTHNHHPCWCHTNAAMNPNPTTLLWVLFIHELFVLAGGGMASWLKREHTRVLRVVQSHTYTLVLLLTLYLLYLSWGPGPSPTRASRRGQHCGHGTLCAPPQEQPPRPDAGW
jgi:hypothetical protein